jgi:hypothetical protein
MSQLDAIVKETRAAFIIAKADGVLDAGEVIQIAHTLALKLYGVTGLDINEKKSLLLYTLKKGLDDDGGVDTLAGMVGASVEVKEAFKTHLIDAASASADLMLEVNRTLTRATSWIPAWVWGMIPGCTKAVALHAKDQQLIRDALAFTGGGTDVVTLIETGAATATAPSAVDLSGAATATAASTVAVPGTVAESN